MERTNTSISMHTPVIGVMGGHRVPESVIASAYELGTLIARRGWILLNGGRNVGVMAASARGAREAGGLVIGILPGKTNRGASPDLTVSIPTGLGDGRNLINVYASDAVVACYGALGTLSEVVFAVKHNKPVVLLGMDAGSALDRYRRRGRISEARDAKEAVHALATVLENAQSDRDRSDQTTSVT